MTRLSTFSSATLVAEAVCTAILDAAREAIAAQGSFKLVLAGGSSLEHAYRLLAQQPADWSKWHIYYGDERCLPADDPNRNSVIAEKALLNHVNIPAANIHTIPAELGNRQAALLYQQHIVDAMPFNMVLLGMGEDGHTASLFPKHEHPNDELVHAVFDSPKPPPERVSLSATALSNAQRVLFVITGEGKRAALKQWQAGVHLPVCMIQPAAGVDIYLDHAAAG